LCCYFSWKLEYKSYIVGDDNHWIWINWLAPNNLFVLYRGGLVFKSFSYSLITSSNGNGNISCLKIGYVIEMEVPYYA